MRLCPPSSFKKQKPEQRKEVKTKWDKNEYASPKRKGSKRLFIASLTVCHGAVTNSDSDK